MMIMSLNERGGGDTPVSQTMMGEMEGPPINYKSRLEGENAGVLISAAWMSKKIRACLKPSLIGGLILIAWCLLASYSVTYAVFRYTRMVCLCMDES